MKSQIVNLTQHDIVIYPADTPNVIAPGDDWPDPIYIIPASGTVCRLATAELGSGEEWNGVPTDRVAYGRLTGLPAPEIGTLYLVALPCVSAALAMGRTDIVTSHRQVRAYGLSGPGAVVGCRSIGLPQSSKGL